MLRLIVYQNESNFTSFSFYTYTSMNEIRFEIRFWDPIAAGLEKMEY